MENITEPNESFDFSKLSLAHPTGIQGGAYFTKILYNSKPLYIQTVKSLTRQGVVKSGKKYYCDLMFDNNAEVLIRWFENLEEKCQQLLFEKHLNNPVVRKAFIASTKEAINDPNKWGSKVQGKKGWKERYGDEPTDIEIINNA